MNDLTKYELLESYGEDLGDVLETLIRNPTGPRTLYVRSDTDNRKSLTLAVGDWIDDLSSKRLIVAEDEPYARWMAHLNLGEVGENTEFVFHSEDMRSVLMILRNHPCDSIKAFIYHEDMEAVIYSTQIRKSYIYEAIRLGYITKTKQPKGRAIAVSISAEGLKYLGL